LDVAMLIVHIELESGYSGNTLTLVGIILGALSHSFFAICTVQSYPIFSGTINNLECSIIC